MFKVRAGTYLAVAEAILARLAGDMSIMTTSEARFASLMLHVDEFEGCILPYNRKLITHLLETSEFYGINLFIVRNANNDIRINIKETE